MLKYRREFYIERLVLSFLIASLAMLMVFSFAYWISYKNYQGVTNRVNIVEENLLELRKLGANLSCDERILIESSKRLDEIGSKIGLLESTIGKNDLRVIEQKKLYADLEIEHFNIVRNLNYICNRSFITILFFYSNEEELRDESERVGFILGTFKKRAENRIMIYSFDYGIDYETINRLKKKYEINAIPIIVVNEKDKIILRNINQLDKYMPDTFEMKYKN
ncbi:MAG: hypothetical protein QXO70_02775 [Candidatus Pacearchaeota archaeon]